MKYSKSCLILDVVVQIEKDTSMALHILLCTFSSRISSWLAKNISSQKKPGNARAHIFGRSVLLGLFKR